MNASPARAPGSRRAPDMGAHPVIRLGGQLDHLGLAKGPETRRGEHGAAALRLAQGQFEPLGRTARQRDHLAYGEALKNLEAHLLPVQHRVDRNLGGAGGLAHQLAPQIVGARARRLDRHRVAGGADHVQRRERQDQKELSLAAASPSVSDTAKTSTSM